MSHPRLSEIPSCGVCNTTENVLRCQSCKVMFYCGKPHQALDGSSHRKSCRLIKKFQRNIATLERTMQERPQFERLISVDSIIELEIVCLNYNSLARELLQIKTFHAVEQGLNCCMEVLRNHRINHLDFKYIVPSFLLRLGRDQKCYDFVKWYAVKGQESDYKWEDPMQPYLDVTNASRLEPIDVLFEKPPIFCHAIALLLIKLRLIQSIQNSSNSPENLPKESDGEIHGAQNCGDRSNIIKTLESELELIYEAVKMTNKYFWPSLLKPADTSVKHNLCQECGSHHCEECAILAVQFYHHCFDETPGAISKVEKLSVDEATN